MQIDPKTMTVEALKALAYEQILLLNQTQANLQALQLEIQNKEKEQDGATKDKTL